MRDDATTERTTRGSERSEAAESRAREGRGENGTAVETSKFDLGAPPPEFETGQLPWSYGEDRITALVRSPDSIYVYWEITDDAIAAARRRLGAAGEWAWCNLRVYDTTGRDFDGTNAHDYFDLRVERGDREWFLVLRRPAASFHVEIGMKSHEGFFQAIARSGRADCPRSSPSPNGALEWMTVTGGEAHPAARPYESKYRGPEHSWQPPPAAPAHGGQGAAAPPGEAPAAHVEDDRSWTWAHPAHVDVRWEGPWIGGDMRGEWRIRWLDPRAGRAVQSVEDAQWVVGPFPVHLVDPERLEIRFLEDSPVILEQALTGLQVIGPWQITIRNAPTEPQRRVLSTWRVHWTRVEPAQVERWRTVIERRVVDPWMRARVTPVGPGASEVHVAVEGGASEQWRVGASERWALGASEWQAMGASEVARIGASETAFLGASALLYGGASERIGGSERMGASEWVAAGGSAMRIAGASEAFAGASEQSRPARGAGWTEVHFSGQGAKRGG